MLNSFFDPASIAIVGASDDTSKLRGKLMKLVLDSAYDGPVHPVHLAGGEIQGRIAYRRLGEIPGGAELVLIATPGAAVPDVVRDAVAAGAKAAVILSSGVDTAALTEAIGDSGLRYMGPNTEGYIALDGVAATFAAVVEEALAQARPAPRPGRKVSIVSQSGGLGFALFGRGLAENLDFHAVVTTGNEGDIECLDVVDHLLDDGASGVIVMFVEGLKTASRFAAIAAKAADRDVPIVVMKVGRSPAGQRAAVSHTAHLTGADTAYDAIFDRYGVIRAYDMEEMLAATAAFARYPRGRVRHAAVVTTSGGAGAWAADLCDAVGIEVPVLSAALQEEIGAFIPSFGSAANPVDVTAQAVEAGGTPLVRVLERLQHSDEIDAIIVNMGLHKPGRIDALSDLLGPLFAQATKPILFHSHILPAAENMAALAAMGGQAFHSFRGCAAALSALDRHADFRERWSAPTERMRAAPTIGASTGGLLGEAETAALLGAYDVPVPPSMLVPTRDEAMRAATAMGFPVVLKIQSPDIAHKTEVGGVALDVGADDIGTAFDAIVASVAHHAPDALIEGVLVQKMMPKGHELVIGTVRDPDFGPLVMLGSGGIYLEVLKDVVFAVPPITPQQATALIDRLKTAPILKGVRGQPPADLAALASLISRIADLAVTETAIDQLDLNPVFVYPEGGGVVAVDSLAVTAPPPSATHGAA